MIEESSSSMNPEELLDKLLSIAEDPEAPSGDRLRAAYAILDRAGYRRTEELDEEMEIVPCDECGVPNAWGRMLWGMCDPCWEKFWKEDQKRDSATLRLPFTE